MIRLREGANPNLNSQVLFGQFPMTSRHNEVTAELIKTKKMGRQTCGGNAGLREGKEERVAGSEEGIERQ